MPLGRATNLHVYDANRNFSPTYESADNAYPLKPTDALTLAPALRMAVTFPDSLWEKAARSRMHLSFDAAFGHHHAGDRG